MVMSGQCGPVVVSSYSDLSNLSRYVKHIHFRKYISSGLLRKILEGSNPESFSFSRYAFSRLNAGCMGKIAERGIKVSVSRRGRGRPSLMDYG